MNRMEFLAELERLLSGIPEEERQAAVQYYADYLADAGVENEAEALRELGSPEKVAETIKADYYGTEFDETKFDRKNYMEKYGQRSGEHGQKNAAGSGGAQAGWDSRHGGTQGDAPGADAGAGDGHGNNKAKEPWTNNGLKLLLIVLIVIVAGPAAVGIAGGILGIIIGIIGFFVGLVVAAVAITVCGIIMTIAGLGLIVIPPAGMVVTGIGLLLFVLGLTATAGTVKLCMIVFPAMIRGFVDLCRRPFHRKEMS